MGAIFARFGLARPAGHFELRPAQVERGFTNRNLISCIVDPVSLPAASKFLRPELEVVPRERVPKLTAKESEVRKWHEASFAAPQGHI
jgi:hypothetical protein